MFEGEARQMSYALFIETIENKIKGLEHLNYVEEEWNNFVIAMKVTTKQVMSGLPGFSKKPCRLSMLNVPMTVSILSANDEWSFRLQARVRSVGVSCKALPRMPWEDRTPS